MKFLKGFLPNLTIVLSIALVVFVYLSDRNPQPDFLVIDQFKYFAYVYAACSLVCAVVLYVSWRKSTSKPGKFLTSREKSAEKQEETEK